MKKTYTIIMCLLSISTVSLSQSSANGYVGISLGASEPLGDFGSSSFDNDAAGYAQTGLLFDINYAYKLSDKFGVTAMLRFQSNSVDVETMASQAAQGFPGSTWTVSANNWGISGYMVGAYGSLPTNNDRLSFELRSMFGFLTASSPKLRFEVSYNGSEAWVEQAKAETSAFSYLLGAGFKNTISDKLALLVNVDYLGSNPEFNNVDIINNDGMRDQTSFKQSYGTINTSIGLVYLL